jgi:hypothetical protein
MNKRLRYPAREKFFIEIDIPECACELSHKIAQCAITPTSLHHGSDGLEHFICHNCYMLMLRVMRYIAQQRSERPEF